MAAMETAHAGAAKFRRVSERFDLCIIGAGAAGLGLAYGTARLGLRVALIEQNLMGGDCLNYGCVPSKALLHAARQGTDWLAAQAHIRRTIAAIAPADSMERYTGLGCKVIKGTARIIADGRIAVNAGEITAKHIVIATGSKTRIPALFAGIDYLTNETIWDLPVRPEHLLIIGAGAMGAEMADAFLGLGAKVTLIGKFLPREAEALSAPLRTALVAKGAELIDVRVTAAGPGPSLTFADGRQTSGTHILLATGRSVDTAALGLAAGPDGIKTDRGLKVIGRRNLYAMGDCADPEGIGSQRFTHIAGAHASLLVRRIAFKLPARLSQIPPVRVVYTEPELAQIGERKGAQILEYHFSDNDRAIAEDDTSGLVRLVLDGRGRLIGAGITSAQAGEMIGLYALAIAQRLKLSSIAGLVLPYPTRSEAGKRAAGNYFATRLFSSGTRKIVRFLAKLG